MVDNIITCVLSSILFLLSLILYLFCTAYLLPKIFIRPYYKSNNVCDRGVKKYLFEEGRAIVYETKKEVKQYISQYVLSERNGKRFLQCKLDESIKKITYRVLTFNSYDKALGAFEVSESGSREQITQSVELPYDTAYVSIEVKSANGQKTSSISDIAYSGIKIGAFVMLTALATVVQAWITQSFISVIFSLFFNYTNEATVDLINTVAIPAAIGIVLATLVFITRYSREYKIKK